MPELPEVEIVKQSLNKKIINKKIKNVIVRNRKLRFKIPLYFEKILKNKIVKKVDRFSKYIILNFKDNSFCIVHLGMSGTIHIVDSKDKDYFTNTSFYNSPILPKKHNHVDIIFNGIRVIYNDPRRFGFFILIKNKTDLTNRFKHIGPEPFSPKFTIKYMSNFFLNKKKDIKSFLLDQSFVSGIGNIYASEILFLCKINPFKKVGQLNLKECKNIINYSRLVLRRAIKKGGSSIRNFRDSAGKEGSFQKEFNVYQRENLRCLK